MKKGLWLAAAVMLTVTAMAGCAQSYPKKLDDISAYEDVLSVSDGETVEGYALEHDETALVFEMHSFSGESSADDNLYGTLLLDAEQEIIDQRIVEADSTKNAAEAVAGADTSNDVDKNFNAAMGEPIDLEMQAQLVAGLAYLRVKDSEVNDNTHATFNHLVVELNRFFSNWSIGVREDHQSNTVTATLYSNPDGGRTRVRAIITYERLDEPVQVFDIPVTMVAIYTQPECRYDYDLRNVLDPYLR